MACDYVRDEEGILIRCDETDPGFIRTNKRGLDHQTKKAARLIETRAWHQILHSEAGKPICFIHLHHYTLPSTNYSNLWHSGPTIFGQHPTLQQDFRADHNR